MKVWEIKVLNRGNLTIHTYSNYNSYLEMKRWFTARYLVVV